MKTENLKQDATRLFEDIKQELRGGRFSGKLGPLWVFLAVVVLVLWVVSGAPVILLSSAVFLGLLGGPAVWVFWDARRRDLKHPLGWGIFALVTFSVGALVYYLVRPEVAGKVACTGCGQEVSKTFAACPFCGLAVAKPRRTCSSCHSEVEAEWRFCPYCRHEMGAQIT